MNDEFPQNKHEFTGVGQTARNTTRFWQPCDVPSSIRQSAHSQSYRSTWILLKNPPKNRNNTGLLLF